MLISSESRKWTYLIYDICHNATQTVADSYTPFSQHLTARQKKNLQLKNFGWTTSTKGNQAAEWLAVKSSAMAHSNGAPSKVSEL